MDEPTPTTQQPPKRPPATSAIEARAARLAAAVEAAYLRSVAGR